MKDERLVCRAAEETLESKIDKLTELLEELHKVECMGYQWQPIESEDVCDVK